MPDELDILKRAIKRERAARKHAEKILEEKAKELYDVNVQLSKLNIELESKVVQRTKEVHDLAMFPNQNPNPVLRLNTKKEVIFSNKMGTMFLNNLQKGEQDVIDLFYDMFDVAIEKDEVISEVFEVGDVFYLLYFTPFINNDYINIYGVDDTKRHLISNALKDSEVMLKSINETSPDYIFILNNKGEIIYQNRTFGSKSVNNDQLLSIDKVLNFYDKTSFFNHYEQAKNRVNIDFEIQIIFDKSRNKNKYRWFRLRMSHMGQDNDHVLIIATDIDEKKAIMEENLSNAAFISDVMTNLPIDVAVFNPDHTYQFLNNKAINDEKIRNWIIGKTDYDYFEMKGLAFTEADRRKKLFNKAVKTGKQVSWIQEFVKDNEPEYLFRRFYPIYIEGAIRYVIGYGTDITDLKLAEIKIAESEQKYRSLFEKMAQGLIITDQNGIVQMVNPSFNTIMAGKDENFIDSFIMDVFPVVDFDIIQKQSKKSKKFQQASYKEIKFQRIDGNEIWLEMNTSSQFDSNNEFIGTISIISDITERKISDLTMQSMLTLANEPGGKDYPMRLCSLLCKLLDVKHAFIGEFLPEIQSIRSIGNAKNGTIIDNMQYSIEGTPCQTVVGNMLRTYRDDIQSIFPEDTDLQELCIKSYIGVPLFKNNIAFGLIAIMDIKPINDYTFKENILKSVVKRVETEIQRELYQFELIESKDKYQSVVNNINDALIQYDLSGKISFYNSRFLDIFGYEPFEMNDVYIEDLIKSPDGSDMSILSSGIKQKRSIQSYECGGLRKDGTSLWLEIRATSIVEDGMVVGTQSIVRDITEKKESEIEYNRLFELNRKVIDSSDELFYVFNVLDQTTFDNPIVYVSDKCYDVYGISPNELISDSSIWFKTIHPDDIEVATSWVSKVYETKEPAVRVYRIKNLKTGIFSWYYDFLKPILDSEGNVIEVYGSIRNIDDIKNKENELEKTLNELTSRYNEMMQFNYIVSHNLRSPVTNILGLTNLIKTPGMSDQEKGDILDFIVSAATKIDELIKDLNVILSMRSAMDNKREIVHFVTIIKSISISLQHQIRSSKAKIETDFDDTLSIETIKSYLESIFYNITSNAIKYRSPKRNPIVKITIRDHDDHVLIRIKDNGIGIDVDKHKESLFGLYKRFETSVDGKGLGLHMTKTQVESLGGEILLDSTLDKGTTFTIKLPK